MNNTADAPTNCQHREGALGCARATHDATSAHWLTSQPEAAHADLRRNGFWSQLVEAEATAPADPLAKLTASSRGRIARHLVAVDVLYDGDPDWLIDRYVRTFLQGRAMTKAAR